MLTLHPIPIGGFSGHVVPGHAHSGSDPLMNAFALKPLARRPKGNGLAAVLNRLCRVLRVPEIKRLTNGHFNRDAASRRVRSRFAATRDRGRKESRARASAATKPSTPPNAQALLMRWLIEGHHRSRGIQVSVLVAESAMTRLSVFADHQSLSRTPTTVATRPPRRSTPCVTSPRVRTFRATKLARARAPWKYRCRHPRCVPNAELTIKDRGLMQNRALYAVALGPSISCAAASMPLNGHGDGPE